jgi:hypothetical protein
VRGNESVEGERNSGVYQMEFADNVLTYLHSTEYRKQNRLMSM